MPTMRSRSKEEWQGEANREDINAGSLQRIADATEKMASSYDQIRTDRDYWKDAYERSEARYQNLKRSHAALRGQITKLKVGAK